MKESQPSAPIKLLTLVWERAQTATSHSWLKLNHVMDDALSLAIRAGMEFELDDWGKPMDRFRPGYWRHDENHYRLAVIYRNASAWKAIEKYLNRKPFIVPGASIHTSTGDGPAGHGLARVIIGAQFPWEGHRAVVVTSINDAKGYLVACARKPWEQEVDPARHVKPNTGALAAERERIKPGKQYKITHADIKAARKSKEKEESAA